MAHPEHSGCKDSILQPLDFSVNENLAHARGRYSCSRSGRLYLILQDTRSCEVERLFVRHIPAQSIIELNSIFVISERVGAALLVLITGEDGSEGELLLDSAPLHWA